VLSNATFEATGQQTAGQACRTAAGSPQGQHLSK